MIDSRYLWLSPALVGALFVGAATTSSSPALEGTPAVARDVMTFTGKIQEWEVRASGDVLVRLRVDEGRLEGREVYFRTVASRNSTTDFEQYVLDAVLSLHGHGDPIRTQVTAEPGEGEDGTTPARAMSLVAIGCEHEEDDA